jgi:hypothetical protein
VGDPLENLVRRLHSLLHYPRTVTTLCGGFLHMPDGIIEFDAYVLADFQAQNPINASLRRLLATIG